MRMWMVPTVLLCDKHLLGEHGEMHKFIPTFRREYKVHRRFTPIVQIQFKGYRQRHDALASEMLVRGMRHESPLPELPDFKRIYPSYYDLEVDIEYSLADLRARCQDCRMMQVIYDDYYNQFNNTVEQHINIGISD